MREQARHTDGEILDGIRGNADWAVRVVSDAITPLIRHKLFSFEDWEDVRQQCLLKIVVAMRRIENIESFWGLVHKVTVCHVINCNRRVEKTRGVFEPNATEDTNADRVADAPARSAPHDEDVDNRNLFLYVYQRIEETCQRIFYLLFLEEKTYPEAARELDISEGNLRVRLKRCRDKATALRAEAV
jgi:RNA polymerase sigma factor (sigma-70 family)